MEEETKTTKEKVEETVDTGITEEDKKLDVERDARCVPVAKKVLTEIANVEDLKIGITGFKPEDVIAVYKPIAEAVMEELLVREVKHSEVQYIFQLVRQATENVSNMVESSLAKSAKLATARKFGREEYEDITIGDIHQVLMEEVKE